MKNRVKGRGFFISYNTRIAVFFSFSTNGKEWKMGEGKKGRRETKETGRREERRKESWRRETKEAGGKEERKMEKWKEGNRRHRKMREGV